MLRLLLDSYSSGMGYFMVFDATKSPLLGGGFPIQLI